MKHYKKTEVIYDGFTLSECNSSDIDLFCLSDDLDKYYIDPIELDSIDSVNNDILNFLRFQ